MKASLSGKLVIGFMAVALITLIVGVIGWQSSNSLSVRIDELGEIAIPSVDYLARARYSHLDIKMSIRTMTSPYISDEDWKRQIGDMPAIKGNIHDALDAYAKLPKEAEEQNSSRNSSRYRRRWRRRTMISSRSRIGSRPRG
jgi:methyl-accepting chemotaxis protein